MMRSMIRSTMTDARAMRRGRRNLVLLAFALLLPAAALAQGPPFTGTAQVSLTPPANATVGVPFNVAVNVDLTGVTGDCNSTQVPAVLGGYRITVPFDNTKLQFVSASSCGNPQFSATPTATSASLANSGSSVSIADSQTNPANPTGPVCVALLAFQPIAGGTTSLTIDPLISLSSALQSCGAAAEGPAAIPAAGVASAPVTICSPPSSAIILGGTNSTCANASGNIASVLAVVGNTYTWTITNGTIVTNAGDNITFTNGSDAVGNVVLGVTVTDSSGCSSAGSKNIGLSPTANTTITAPASVCALSIGNSASVPLGGATYAWTISGGTITTGSSTSSITFDAGSSGPVVLSVTVTNAAGCLANGSTSVTVVPAPVASASGGGPYCAGSTIQLSVSPVNGTATYSWTGPNSFSSSSPNPTIANSTSANAGTYTVTITDGCSVQLSTAVVVNPAANATITAPSATCPNATGLNASVLSQAGATYAWTITGGTLTSGATGNAITFNAGPSGPITLSVDVTALGGCTASSSATVTVSASPVAVITAPSAVCASSTGNTASVASQAGATYAWSITGGTLTSAPTANSVTFNAGTSSPVVLSIAINANGCISNGSQSVNVNAVPTVTATTGGPYCAGSTIQLNSSSSSGTATYSWTGPNGFTSTLAAPSIPSATPVNAGTYTVTATDNGCSSAPSSVSVVVRPLPSAAILAATSVMPDSTGNGASVANAGAGATYSWSIVNGTITAGAGTSAIVYTAGSGAAVTLNVIVTDGNGCSANGSATVTVTSAPSADLAIAMSAAPTPVAPNGTLSYSLTVSNRGPDLATALTVSDALPTALSGVTVFGTGWSCNINGAFVSCSTANLAPFDSSTITITGTAPSTISTISNLASVGSSTPDPDSSNNTASIDVAVGGCAGAGPSLQSPANGANNLPAAVDFSWTAVTDATSYNLWLASATSTPKLAGTTSGLTLSQSLAAGPFSWFVEAIFASCPPVRSGSFTFTVATPPSCPTAAPQLTAPQDNAAGLQPHVSFAWTSVPNATKYNLWLTVDGSSPFIVASTPDTSIATDVPSGSLTWWVEAAASSCPSTVSSIRHFVVTPLPTCPTAQAAPIAPPQGGTLPNGRVTFSWVAAPSAVAYHVWLSIEDQPAGDIGTTTKTSLTRDLSIGGKFTWFVEAIFNGCPAVRSLEVAFQVSKPEPCESHVKAALITPAANATVASPAPFSWNQAPGAAGYRIWVGVDSAPAEVIATTVDTEGTFPVSSGANEWFVEAFFNGCPSTFSTHGLFTVPAAANCGTQGPALVEPADGATFTDPNATFRWNAVSGAVGYQVWIAVNEGTPVRLDSTEDTTLQHQVSVGSLRWFVRALFNGCPARDSETRTFSIQLAANCSARRPILTSPVDGSRTVLSPVDFEWGAVENATGYRLWVAIEGDAPIQFGPTVITTPFLKDVSLPVGSIEWYVEALFANCPTTRSSNGSFQVPVGQPPCGQPASPIVGVEAEASSGVEYSLHWNRVANAGFYEVQESPTPGFVNARTQTTRDDHLPFQQVNSTGSTVIFYYRVRATSNCGADSGFYSTVVSVAIHPVQSSDSSSLNGSTPVDKPQTSTYTIQLGGSGGSGTTNRLSAIAAGTSFVATTDEPWLTVSPASGTVPPQGLTLTVTASPSTLPIGTSVGSVFINTTDTSSSSRRTSTHGGTSATVPVSINVVQVVSPVAKSGPPPDALIIAATAHANGVGTTFESDVRLANTSPQLLKYLISFTPSGDAGFTVGKQTTIEVDPGQTVALNDVLRSWYGAGTGGANATGVLDIRPLNAQPIISPLQNIGLPNLYTFVSSKTFAIDSSGGTLGQYIQATPFSSFVGKGDATHPNILSLQQIAQSSDFRSNFGLLEGSGEPVSVLLSVFSNAGQKLGAFTVNLKGGEHTQLNSFLAQQNIALSDGRVEVQVTSGTGRVTAYASVLDNRTNDPLLVPAVQPDLQNAMRYTVPGVADLAGPGANWRTDLRIYNASSTATPVTLTFYPQGNASASKSVNMILDPGAVQRVDNILQSTFGVTGDGGAVSVTSDAMMRKVVVTARTYNKADDGSTRGQFVPAVTESDAASLGSRPLQILQLEESNRLRSNLGVVEITGKPATVELTITSAESRVTPVVRLDLAANQFRQITGILHQLNITSYNTRVSVRVVSGEGKVAAYASVVDNTSGDPTYVPAQ